MGCMDFPSINYFLLTTDALSGDCECPHLAECGDALTCMLEPEASRIMISTGLPLSEYRKVEHCLSRNQQHLYPLFSLLMFFSTLNYAFNELKHDQALPNEETERTSKHFILPNTARYKYRRGGSALFLAWGCFLSKPEDEPDFTNELTKFSFLLLGYKKSERPDFAATFRYYLARTLKLHNINSAPYLEQAAEFGRNTKSSRSPLAHISRLKIDFAPSLKLHYGLQGKEELWQRYSNEFNTYLTSYPKRKGYATPAQEMRGALEKRQLL